MVRVDELLGIIDGALERFGGRDLIAASEVVDLLLDLRLCVLADGELGELLDRAQEPATT
jgi:hypothetical protein